MADENTTQSQEQVTQTTPIKRGRGRPLGSKNKPKVSSEQVEKQETNDVKPTAQSVESIG